MDRCSELASPTAPRIPRDFQWRALSGSNRTGPSDADFDIGAVHLGVHNRIGLWWDAQPNESRLSCAAELEYSQMEFYHRRRCGGSFSRWLGCAPMKVARVPPFTSTLGA